MKKLLKLVVTFAICACILGNDVVSVHASSEEEVVSVSVSHQHTSEGGSCYTPVYHTHSDGCYSTGKLTAYRHHAGGHVDAAVNGCNASKTCYWVSAATCSICGNVAYCFPCNQSKATPSVGDVHCTKLVCTKQEGVTVDSYTLDCTQTEVGFVSIVKQGGSGYYLRVNSNIDVDSYRWQDGSTNAIIYVTSNSTYTCEITYTDSGVQRTVSVSYEVTDYDAVPPVISAVEFSSKRVNSGVRPSVSATDNVGVIEYKMVR